MQCAGFLLWQLLPLRRSGSGYSGVSSYGMCSVAPQHVESSWTRICVPCVGRWILIHRPTREVQDPFYNGRRLLSLEFGGVCVYMPCRMLLQITDLYLRCVAVVMG